MRLNVGAGFLQLSDLYQRAVIETHIDRFGRASGRSGCADESAPRTTAHGARPANPATRPTLQPIRSALQGPRITDHGSRVMGHGFWLAGGSENLSGRPANSGRRELV
jgi:hypothetical protein